jgi:hypothetical protein
MLAQGEEIFIPASHREKSCNKAHHSLGACRNSIFSFFLPFLAKKVVPDSRFSESRFFQGRLLVIL